MSPDLAQEEQETPKDDQKLEGELSGKSAGEKFGYKD
jgi:hypothetical protein